MEVLFWVLFALIFWALVGYPATMLVRARLWPRPFAADPAFAPTVSVVLAVRNGAEHLAARVENLLGQAYPAERLQVLIACNGCTDDSEAVAARLAAREPRLRVLSSPAGEGKAGALNRAVAAATGECLVFADVRQRYAPDALRRLVAPLADPSVGAASGRLVIGQATDPGVEGVRWYWGLETALRLAESRTGSVVGVTGAIYAMPRARFEPLPPNLILDDLWLPLHLAQAGRRVVLVPEAVAYDVPSASLGVEYRRKRRTLVGNLQLLRLRPELLLPQRNPLFARFVSHKLLRLLVPLCFLGMLAAAATLPALLYRVVLGGGLGVFAAGAAGLRLQTRWLAPAASFLLLHVAVFGALRRFRHDATTIWQAPATGGELAAGTLAPAEAPPPAARRS